jgi:hypothetical protein
MLHELHPWRNHASMWVPGSAKYYWVFENWNVPNQLLAAPVGIQFVHRPQPCGTGPLMREHICKCVRLKRWPGRQFRLNSDGRPGR